MAHVDGDRSAVLSIKGQDILARDYFSLFELPRQYRLDRTALDASYRTLQQLIHPDRFVGASSSEQRIALHWATHVNDAYNTLRHPRLRIDYLLSLLQAPDASATPELLEQQMEWRERADDCGDEVGKLRDLAHELQALEGQIIARLEAACDDAHDYVNARSLSMQLQYCLKLREDIAWRLSNLGA